MNFGDWDLNKRDEYSFRDALRDLGESDWAFFRATDDDGDPLTVDRESQRLLVEEDDQGNEITVFSPTIFRSDVYFSIAPEGLIDNDEQMKATFKEAEKEGAASSHKLVTVQELRNWIENERAASKHLYVFTDDILFIDRKYRDLLESFSEFVRFFR